MVATITSDVFPKELDSRHADGVEVRLLWSKRTNRLWVSVDDERTGEAFEFDVDPADALDAFHHPYAYAASSGVEYREPVRVPQVASS